RLSNVAFSWRKGQAEPANALIAVREKPRITGRFNVGWTSPLRDSRWRFKMDEHASRWAEFLVRHQEHLLAIAAKQLRKGTRLPYEPDDILNDVAAAGLCHPTVKQMLAEKPETEALKYVAQMVRNQVRSLRRRERAPAPPPLESGQVAVLDAAQLRDQVR